MTWETALCGPVSQGHPVFPEAADFSLGMLLTTPRSPEGQERRDRCCHQGALGPPGEKGVRGARSRSWKGGRSRSARGRREQAGRRSPQRGMLRSVLGVQRTSVGRTDIMNEAMEARNRMVYDPSLDANSQWVETGRKAITWDTQVCAPPEGHPACGKVTDLTYFFLRASSQKSWSLIMCRTLECTACVPEENEAMFLSQGGSSPMESPDAVNDLPGHRESKAEEKTLRASCLCLSPKTKHIRTR